MKILAVETSCDETGIAVVEGAKTAQGFAFTVLKNELLSQAQRHAPYGGVYPNLAKREHEKNLPVLFEQFKKEKVDAVAVTVGPGLEPALWTGITFAQKLCREWELPLLPVNHMEGHLISSLAQPAANHSSVLQNVRMPVLGLLISGGHTEFVLMRDWFDYQIIGETLDDAVGEAFDKVARMLELPYPGGPEISKLADKARSAKEAFAGAPQGDGPRTEQISSKKFVYPENASFALPRPMLNSKNCDVSFSGLKTAALYSLRGKNLNDDEKALFAAEFEDAVADVFVAKTRRALDETGAKTFVIGGGVAANRFIREQLQQLLLEEFPDVEMRLPELNITGDNAIMIGEAALAHLLSGDWKLEKNNFQEIRATGNLSISTLK